MLRYIQPKCGWPSGFTWKSPFLKNRRPHFFLERYARPRKPMGRILWQPRTKFQHCSLPFTSLRYVQGCHEGIILVSSWRARNSFFLPSLDDTFGTAFLRLQISEAEQRRPEVGCYLPLHVSVLHCHRLPIRFRSG